MEKVTITFIIPNADNITASFPVGTSLLDAAREVGAPLPGVCEASLACSTCHVIIEDDDFFELTKQNLENHELTEEEEDLLDMAPEVEPNSRLGCQVILTSDMDGMVVKVPATNRNEA